MHSCQWCRAGYNAGNEIVCIDKTRLKTGETVSKGYVNHHVAQHSELLLAPSSELHKGLPYAHVEDYSSHTR